MESAVGLLLVEAGERSNAMTVSCFSEVAHHPTTLWVSVAKTTYSDELIKETRRFSLAVLSLNQKAEAISCGSVSGKERNKCAALDLYHSPSGFLFLRGALASTGCRVKEIIEIDDQTLFLADIVETNLDTKNAHLRHLLLADLRDS